MARYVGFVRNVMIGREGLHRTVLLEAVESAGGADPVSYISTGNVTFDLAPAKLRRFRADLEDRIAAVIGRTEPVFIRSFAELAHLHARNPFEPPPFADVHDRVVTFCADPVEGVLELPSTTDRGDVVMFAAAGREVFTVTRLVDGRTGGPGGIIEQLIGARVTTRAWSTVDRIVARAGR
jgi:uncharacterized protein (DUF1697 family)